MGKYDRAERDAYGEPKKEQWLSNAGGRCAISGCTEPATATNAVTGLAYAKWYCPSHMMAMNNGAGFKDLNKVSYNLKIKPVEYLGHWADRMMDGVPMEQLVADDKAQLNNTRNLAKF